MVQTLKKKTARVASVFAAGVLLLTQFAFMPSVVGATQNQYHKVDICHGTASYTNPYVKINVDKDAVDGNAGNDNGQGDHYLEHQGPIFYSTIPKHTEWGDIIPPVAGVHSGLNWTTEGQAIYNNNCNYPKGEIEVHKKVDADGNNTYEGGDSTANSLGFRWALDDETPATRTMGSDEDVTTGTHTITEKMVNGYVFTGWYYSDDTSYSCADPRGTTLPVSVNVEKNKTKKVTLCNQAKNGNITIIKDAQPNNDQNFYFAIDKQNSQWDDDFTLDDDGNNGNQYSNTKSFNNLLAGTYVITETSTDGWTLGNIVCSDGATVVVDKAQRKVTITLDHDDAVTCTFVNQKNGKLKVYKHTDPSGDKTDFGIEATAVSGAILSDPTKTIADGEHEEFYVTQGTYTINETLPAGWAQTQNTCVNVVVSADNLYPTCHIYNSKQARLKIVKDAYPSGEQAFGFTSDWGSFNLKDDESKQFSSLGAGQYTIGEDALNNWDLTGLTCVGADGYSVNWQNHSVTVTLKAGNDATCTFTNEQRSAIHGYKFEDVNGNGEWDDGEGTLEGWTIKLAQLCEGEDDWVTCEGSEQTTVTDQGGYYRFDGLHAGYYQVCEVQQAGWAQTYPWWDDCHFIELGGQGSEQYANFGNFQLGRVEGVKFNDVNGNGQRDENEPLLKDWEITLTKVCESNNELRTDNVQVNSCDDPQVTKTDAQGAYSFGELMPGTYKVCETQKATWQQTYPNTTDGCHEFTIETSGQVVTADFGNKAKPQILGDQTTQVLSAQTLVNTGTSATKSIVVGLTILAALGAIHFLHSRRKDYAK